jgi:hypothetical protein
MVPQLAAYLTWAFVLYLLIRDHRNAPKTLPGLWVATLWFLILATKPPHYWFAPSGDEVGTGAYEDGNSFNQIVYLSLTAMGMFVLWRRKIAWLDIFSRNLALLGLFGFSVLSALWADYPYSSVKGSVKVILGNWVMAMVVLSDPNPLQAIKTLIRRCTFVVAPLSVMTIKYFPRIGRQTHRWTYETAYKGIVIGANALGTTSYICGLMTLWLLIRPGARADKREFGINLFLLLMLLWLMNKADGGTANVSLGLSVLLLVCLRWNIFRPAILATGRHIAVVLSLFAPILILNYAWFMDAVSYLFGHNDTLWGRLEVWRQVTALVDNPILGTGYNSYWLGDRLATLWEIYGWGPTQAHNGYVETYLNLGLVGVALLTTVIFAVCRKAAVLRWKPELQILKLSFLLPILFFNLTEAAFRGLHIVWFAFLLFAIETPGQLDAEAAKSGSEQPVRGWQTKPGPKPLRPGPRTVPAFGMRGGADTRRWGVSFRLEPQDRRTSTR